MAVDAPSYAPQYLQCHLSQLGTRPEAVSPLALLGTVIWRCDPRRIWLVTSHHQWRIASRCFESRRTQEWQCRARVQSGGTGTGCAYGRTRCPHSRAQWSAILAGWKLTSRHVVTTAWQGPACPHSRLSACFRISPYALLRQHIEEHLICQWRRCCLRTRGIASVLGAGKAADFRARELALNFNEGRQHYTKHDSSSQTLEGDRNTAESMFLHFFCPDKTNRSATTMEK